MTRNHRIFTFMFLFISVLFLSSISQAGVISPALRFLIQSSAPDEEISVIITLSDQADLSLIKAEKDKHLRRSKIIKELKDKADRIQGPLKALLEGTRSKRMVPLWIINAIAATLPAGRITGLADFPGVGSVDLDYAIEAPPVTLATAAPPEWNISAIKAPGVWDIGFTGVGVVVANTDTGVDVFHPDLNSNWRGGANSWFNPYADPTNAGQCAIPNSCSPCELSSSTPCDPNGHGTGTMGIMVGGSAGGTAIGVAPDAKWIAVKVLNDARSGATSIILQGFEWILGLPPAEAPDVVNNSWGFGNVNGCNTSFQNSIGTMKAAGFEVIFSAGNSGPGASTSISPANNPGTFAVGATDINDAIASFSSRGPSACDGSIFPHVVAPGVNVRTSGITTGGLFPSSYVTVSGTSFSAPHVAGAMALLLTAFPSLTPAEIESILEQTAFGLGTPVPNNDYGYGLVDIANAYKNAFDTINGNIPEIASLPASYNFGNVEILASPSNLFTIVNRGIADLSITNISVTGPDSSEFVKQIAGDTCSGQTIPSLSTCTVPVLFSPTSVGPNSAVVSIQSNDPVQPFLDLPLSASVLALIPGATISAPATAWNETAQKLHIAVRGANGSSIWVGSINSNGTFNNDWTKIPGATSDAPALAWDATAQKLYIAVREANGSSIWVGSINSSGVFNNDWTQIPGATSDAPAIAWNDTAQKLHIVVRGVNGNSIWVGSISSNGQFNNDWAQLPGTTSDAPAIAWNGTAQKLHIAVRGANGNSIWVGSISSNGQFNNDWTLLGGTSSSAPSAAFNSLNSKLHVILRKVNSTIEEWATQ